MSEKRLRSGYTTGTCASAAAKAAALFLLTGIIQEEVTVKLPGGTSAVLPVRKWEDKDGRWGFGVEKDAGDDPDVTHGTLICAEVWVPAEHEILLENCRGCGYVLEEYQGMYLTGGEGVGMVTKPGLSCPVGHYAINPVPRKMILLSVDEARMRAACEENLMIRISVPAGERLAEKTFNPRLGIEGGISILGTTGIVRPMSEEALLATIRLDIHMQAVNRGKILLMAPGNYGESFLQEKLDVPIGSAVLCSNFVADAMNMAAAEPAEAVLFVGHIGKLVKVAAGMRNTHSRYGDGRMKELAHLTADETGSDTGLALAVQDCNTTEEAMGILMDAGLAERILKRAAEKVKLRITGWTEKKICVEVITFSSAYGVAGYTKEANGLLKRWETQKKTR